MTLRRMVMVFTKSLHQEHAQALATSGGFTAHDGVAGADPSFMARITSERIAARPAHEARNRPGCFMVNMTFLVLIL